MKKDTIGIYYLEAVIQDSSRYLGRYIGKSKECENRIETHLSELRFDKHDNPRLQAYFNKYKNDFGEFSIDYNVLMRCPQNELNFWEKFWIQCLDARNYFNDTDGGDNPPIRYRKCVLTNMKTKETISCDSILEFAQKYNLQKTQISAVLRGISNFVGDWYSENNKWRPQYYYVISPDGEKFEVINIKQTEFCKFHNIKARATFGEMLRGKYETCEGWKRPDSKNVEPACVPKRFELISPEGKLVTGRHIENFCIQNNLHSTEITKLLQGKIYHHKKWRKYDKDSELKPFDIEESRKNWKSKNKGIKLINPEGELVIVNDLKIFSEKSGLKRTKISCLLNETVKVSEGWRLYKEDAELKPYNKNDFERRSSKKYKLVSPNGEIFITNNLSKFSRERGLPYSSLAFLCYGTYENVKGWTKYKEETF